MSKLAAAVDAAVGRRAQHGGAALASRRLAEGPGWHVADVVCASGPRDRPFEERHDSYAIAIVAAGTFRYRAGDGEELMTPGSLMLGRPGRCYECGHEHGAGDRCISFWYDEDYFERLAHDAGGHGFVNAFRPLRIPAVPELSPLVAQACAGISGAHHVAWEQLAIRLAAATVRLAGDGPLPHLPIPPAARRRVAGIVRSIERRPDATLTLGGMAHACGLSPFHFLRTFEQVAGTTPHQFVMRTRLREAARRLASTRDRVIDIALECGFGDPPHFTRAFRAEFGVSPRKFRSSTQSTQPTPPTQSTSLTSTPMHLTMDELHAGLDEIRSAPRNEGILKLIVRRPAVDAREVLDVGELNSTDGLAGDTWRIRSSSRSADGKAHPDMQLNIMSARAVALVAQSPERWKLAGDQLFVDLDLSGANLPPGTRLSIGTAVVEVTPQPHTGCNKFVSRFGLDAMKFVNSPVGRELNLRGINAKVVKDGTIRVGDRVTVRRPEATV